MLCRVAPLLLAIIALAGCTPTPSPPPNSVTVRDALVQYSLVASLAVGDYVGGTPLRTVLQGGDFGLGTFDRLDGEMIVLDGQIYQALADGSIRRADLSGTSPFAAVTFFQEDGRAENFAAATLDELDQQLDGQLPHRNHPYAIRIDGEFAELTLRSVPGQSPPYEPLVDVVKQQVTWQHRNLRGTLVGLRCPSWVGQLNVSGYHWHFLTDDRTIGGHVLACRLTRGLVRYDECTAFVINLPNSSEFNAFEAGQINERDIDQIERQRAKQ